MIYKHTFVALLALSGAPANAKRRRTWPKHKTYLLGGWARSMTPSYSFPGDAELFQSFINKEVENNYLLKGLDEEFEDEQKKILMTVGDRTHRPGTHKPNGKPWPISDNLPLPEGLSMIQNAGGLSFCREFYKTEPENVNSFCDKYNSGALFCILNFFRSA